MRRWHGDCAKWLRTTRLDVNYKEIPLARHVLIARHANGTRPRAAYELRVSFGVETWPRTPVVSSRADAVSCVLRPSGQSAAAGPLALGTPARSRPRIERRWSRRTPEATTRDIGGLTSGGRGERQARRWWELGGGGELLRGDRVRVIVSLARFFFPVTGCQPRGGGRRASDGRHGRPVRELRATFARLLA